jgi:hypothetical protein
MISLFLFAAVSLPLEKWPDPLIGFSFRTHSQDYVTTEADPETETPAVISKRRRKYFQLGASIDMVDLSEGAVRHLNLVLQPEFHISPNVFLWNTLLGLEQDIPFRSYRSFPKGIHYSLLGGLHLGFLTDPAGHLSSTGQKPSMAERTSIAFATKAQFGPYFGVGERSNLKVFFGLDAYFGKIGNHQTAMRFSDIIGSVLSLGLKMDFGSKPSFE